MKKSKAGGGITQQEAIQLASLPVVDIILRVDLRSGQVMPYVIGGQLPFQAIYEALDRCKEYVHVQEVAAYQQQIEALQAKEEKQESA